MPRYLALRFTYSRQRSFYREGRTLQMLLFDGLDIHLFTQDARFTNRTGLNALVKDRGEHDYRDLCALRLPSSRGHSPDARPGEAGRDPLREVVGR